VVVRVTREVPETRRINLREVKRPLTKPWSKIVREPIENRILPEDVKITCNRKAITRIYLKGRKLLIIQFPGSSEERITIIRRKEVRIKPIRFSIANRAKTNRNTRVIFALGSSRCKKEFPGK